MTNSNSEHITALEAAELLGTSRSALCNRRKAGLAPAWVNIASPEARARKVRYILSDVLAFRDERNSEQRPTISELAVRMATLVSTVTVLVSTVQYLEKRLAVAERKLGKRKSRGVTKAMMLAHRLDGEVARLAKRSITPKTEGA